MMAMQQLPCNASMRMHSESERQTALIQTSGQSSSDGIAAKHMPGVAAITGPVTPGQVRT